MVYGDVHKGKRACGAESRQRAGRGSGGLLGTTIQEGDVYRAAHATRRRTTTIGEVDDVMEIKAERVERARWRAESRASIGHGKQQAR
jgi:hypothetical protein